MSKIIYRLSAGILALAAVWLLPSHLLAALTNGSADLVLGQAVFTSSGSACTQNGLNYPSGVAIDASSGRVYICDTNNNRVLWWNNAVSLINGKNADGVLGQYNFTANASTCTQTGMNQPYDAYVDGSGNLWVADTNNCRILKFINPSTNGQSAVLVIGQPNFTSSAVNCTEQGMTAPVGIAIDSSGNLWVVDDGNNRVLEFVPPFNTFGSSAALVLGQPDFTSHAGTCTQTGMFWPVGLRVDNSKNIWVTDYNNNRILEIVPPFNTFGSSATLVLGQTVFTSSGSACTQNGLNYPTGVAIDAVNGRVYICDGYNNRVLWWNNSASLVNGQNADGVIGQSDYVAHAANCSRTGLNGPGLLCFDSFGNLWVPDSYNNRVLRFNTLSVTSITPNSAVNTGPVSITNLAGTGFLAGTAVKLSKTGHTDINAANINIVSESKITCTFDLTGQATGYWDVAVSTGGAGSLSAVLSNGFQIANAVSNTEVVDPAHNAEITINPPSGEIKVDIPAGTFGQTVTVTLSTAAVPSSDKPTIKVGNICIEITNSLNLQPNGSITIAMHYNPADIATLGLMESKLAICRYDAAQDLWIPIPFTLDTKNHVITATIDHFSIFVLVQFAGATNLDQVKVYPNPLNSRTQGQMTIENLTVNATIKIYNIAGDLVRTLNYTTANGQTKWDGRNDSGSTVASGVYIMYINAPEGTKKIKVAIEK